VGGRGAVTPWIFIHGTKVVNESLIVLFFGLFLLFFGLCSVALPSPGNFSADALVYGWGTCCCCCLGVSEDDVINLLKSISNIFRFRGRRTLKPRLKLIFKNINFFNSKLNGRKLVIHTTTVYSFNCFLMMLNIAYGCLSHRYLISIHSDRVSFSKKMQIKILAYRKNMNWNLGLWNMVMVLEACLIAKIVHT